MSSRATLFFLGFLVFGPVAIWIINRGRQRAVAQEFWPAMGYIVLFLLWEALAPAMTIELWYLLGWRI